MKILLSSWLTVTSRFMVHQSVFDTKKDRTKRITGFKQRRGFTNNLECSLYVGRLKISYFSDLISKIICTIIGWQTKQLNFGGRVLLINHFIQAVSIHLISAIPPPPNPKKRTPKKNHHLYTSWLSKGLLKQSKLLTIKIVLKTIW